MLMMMRADEGYTPNEKCSLEEMVACALADDTDACLAACTGNENPEEPAGDGLITVKKVGTTTTQEVPYFATNIKVGSIKLTAWDADTKVSSVEISREGLWDFDDQYDWNNDSSTTDSALYVTLRSDTIETDTVAVSLSKETARVKFSPAITIKAWKSETFDVVVDTVAGYENATHNFTVTAVNVSNGTATGLPVSLWTVKTTSASPKTVNVTLEDGDTATLIAGDTDKLLAKVHVIFDKSAGKLDRFSLENTVLPATKLWEAFENVYAYVDWKKVGKVYMSDDKIVVSNLAISMDKDEEVSIEVRWDIIYEESAASFLFDLSSIDTTNNGYGLIPDATSTLSQGTALTVGWADTSFTKVALTATEFLPGKTNITVFNAKFKPAINVQIDTATIACTDTLTAASLKPDSAQLIVDWEEFDIADADLIAGAATFTNMKIDVDANSEITVKMVLSTKKPTWTTALIDEAIQCSVVLDGRGIEDTTNVFTSKTVKAEKVEVKEWFATVADAVEQWPVTRSLFSNKEQEAGRFSIEAEWDNVTLNELVFDYTTSITDPDDVETILNTLTIVDAASNTELTSDDADVDTTAGTITFKNIKNYTIDKDKTVDLKAMLNLSDISSFYGETLLLTVSDMTVKSSIRTIDSTINAITATDLSDIAYTFRMNAPTITLTKVSENKFKVVIKNADKDNAVYVDTLRYRVRALADDSTFAWTVCLADDSSVIECDLTDPHVLDTHNFGVRFDGLTTEVQINWNQSKTYYIVVDWTSIEPEVLQADISKLSYGDVSGSLNPENYSASAK